MLSSEQRPEQVIVEGIQTKVLTVSVTR